MEGIYCDRCGKLMIENGQTMIGMIFTVTNIGTKDFSTGFIKKQLGKYASEQVQGDITFRREVCWECMLDAFLGGKVG